MDHQSEILKFDGSNYSSWSYRMYNCVFNKHLLELVDGSVSKPGLNDLNLLKIWEAKNAEVLSLINDFIDPAIKKHLAVFKSAKEAWNYLARLYAHSTLAENFCLERGMRAISQGDRTIEELRDILVGFWDKLAAMEPKDLSGLDSFKKYREEQRLVQLLVALRDDFEPLRRSVLQRSTFPSVQEAVEELITEERRLKELNVPPPQAQLESLSINPRFDHQVAKIQCIHCHQTLKKDKNKLTVKSQSKYHQPVLQPSSETSRPAASHLTPDNEDDQPILSRDMFLSGVKLVAQIPPLESACYLSDSDEEDYDQGTALSTLKILSYNVWSREDVELHKRMESIGNLIRLHSPDVICFQEVTPNIFDIFKQSNWWEKYTCSISDEMARTRRYFCIQLSKLPVRSFHRKPFSNSRMGRELCTAEIEVKGVHDDPLIVATSHLKRPEPGQMQMHSEERIAQAKAALTLLGNSPNMIFCGDMNWDDDLDGRFPLFGGWIDAWEELRRGEDGWTYDTKSNPMLLGNRPLRKRLDRFVCNLNDFKLDAIEMIGLEAIPGVSYSEKEMRKGARPVLPSDHYGLLLQLRI
ncbi:hypothetical protein LWI29_014265 [Acer saccharum]|uniref:Endonuclease/exonuclease/phosphatase domain-containing protein n=1 Tax=Acer saccharum TaxID=4024 RepID=A0AA39RQY9_ACESA|nr:hypothetical protein LWI29_014265 [Acer saccharum]